MSYIFGWVLRSRIYKGERGGHAHFLNKSDPKNKNFWRISAKIFGGPNQNPYPIVSADHLK